LYFCIIMAEWKAFFSMTRHERAGAIVVLVMLVLVIGLHVFLSHRSVDDTATDIAGIEAFERRCDSITAVKQAKAGKDGLAKGKDDGNRVKGKPHKSDATAKPNKPAQDSPLAPVPGF